MQKNIEEASQRFEEKQKRRRTGEDRGYDKSVQTDDPPTFTHPEIELLYKNDMRINRRTGSRPTARI